jgi:hypothetical protein
MCFLPGTSVIAARGSIPIESITAGTQVLARNLESKEIHWRSVVEVFATRVNSVVSAVRLSLQSTGGALTEIRVTPAHPFYVHGKSWVEAGALVPGRDHLIDPYGRLVRVTKRQSIEALVPLYAFEVDGFHTYFVGQAGVLVHNRGALPR